MSDGGAFGPVGPRNPDRGAFGPAGPRNPMDAFMDSAMDVVADGLFTDGTSRGVSLVASAVLRKPVSPAAVKWATRAILGVATAVADGADYLIATRPPEQKGTFQSDYADTLLAGISTVGHAIGDMRKEVRDTAKALIRGEREALPSPSELPVEQVKIVSYLRDEGDMPEGLSPEITTELQDLKGVLRHQSFQQDVADFTTGFDCLGKALAHRGHDKAGSIFIGGSSLATAYGSYEALSTGGVLAGGKLLPICGHLGIIAGSIMVLTNLFDSSKSDDSMEVIGQLLYHLCTEMESLRSQVDRLGLHLDEVDRRLFYVQNLVIYTTRLISKEAQTTQGLVQRGFSTHLTALQSLAYYTEYALDQLSFRSLEVLLDELANPMIAPSFDTLVKQAGELSHWIRKPIARDLLVGAFWARCADSSKVTSVILERISHREGRGAWALGYLSHFLGTVPPEDLSDIVNIDFTLFLLQTYKDVIKQLLQTEAIYADKTAIITMLTTTTIIRKSLKATKRAMEALPLMYNQLAVRLAGETEKATKILHDLPMVEQRKLDEALIARRGSAWVEDTRVFSAPISWLSEKDTVHDSFRCLSHTLSPACQFVEFPPQELKTRLQEQGKKVSTLMEKAPLDSTAPFTLGLPQLIENFKYHPRLIRDWALVLPSLKCRGTVLPCIASDLGAVPNLPLFMMAEQLGLGEIISLIDSKEFSSDGLRPILGGGTDKDESALATRSGDQHVVIEVFFKTATEVTSLAKLNYNLPQFATPRVGLPKAHSLHYDDKALLPVLPGEYDSIAGAQTSNGIHRAEGYFNNQGLHWEGPKTPAYEELWAFWQQPSLYTTRCGTLWNPDGLSVVLGDRFPYRIQTGVAVTAETPFVSDIHMKVEGALVALRKTHFSPEVILRTGDILDTVEVERARLLAWGMAMGITIPECFPQDKIWNDSVPADKSPFNPALAGTYKDIATQDLLALPRSGPTLNDKIELALDLIGHIKTSLHVVKGTVARPKPVAPDDEGDLKAQIDRLQRMMLQTQEQMSLMQGTMHTLLGRLPHSP